MQDFTFRFNYIIFILDYKILENIDSDSFMLFTKPWKRTSGGQEENKKYTLLHQQ